MLNVFSDESFREPILRFPIEKCRMVPLHKVKKTTMTFRNFLIADGPQFDAAA